MYPRPDSNWDSKLRRFEVWFLDGRGQTYGLGGRLGMVDVAVFVKGDPTGSPFFCASVRCGRAVLIIVFMDTVRVTFCRRSRAVGGRFYPG